MTDNMFLITYISLGLFFGVLISIIYQTFIKNKSLLLAKTALKQYLETQNQSLDKAFLQLQSQMKDHAFESLNQSTKTILQVSSGQLNNNQQAVSKELNINKEHINKQVSHMESSLEKLTTLVLNIEKNQQVKMSELNTLLVKTNEQNENLIKTTTSINHVFSNSQERGQWGERIADDILKLVGFIENINYKKQFTLPTGERPDFTFLLPQKLYLHMDVKFPIVNYRKYLNSSGRLDKEKFKKLFFIDIKNCIKDITKRNYMDPKTTICCSLIFIPHEQAYGFIQQEAPEIFDQSMQQNIIPCSPMSLFAILAIIRKSLDIFYIQQTSQDILQYLQSFKKQWQLYNKCFDNLGKKITEIDAEYQKLVSTREKQLTTIVNKITKLQQRTPEI